MILPTSKSETPGESIEILYQKPKFSELTRTPEKKNEIAVNSFNGKVKSIFRWYGIKQYDEVIILTHEFTDLYLSVIHIGAKPVIIDVATQSLSNHLRDAINERTKIILIVDCGKWTCDYNEIISIVNSEKSIAKFKPSTDKQFKLGRILLVSDALNSFDAKYPRKSYKIKSDISLFSYNTTKKSFPKNATICLSLPNTFIINEEIKLLRLYSLIDQNKIGKRIFDFLISSIGLLILTPFLIMVSILIKFDSEGPIFYLQTRVGRFGKDFKLIKFRTMKINSDQFGLLTVGSRDFRVTRLGYWLRKFKIDELPQLINVLIGNMSFVGPRPQVRKYVSMYSKKQLIVLNLRPGITDYASLKFINESDLLAKANNPEYYYINQIMPVKLNLNLEYIEKNNLISDLKIIFLTIFRVLGF